jgi:hypothetical protein
VIYPIDMIAMVHVKQSHDLEELGE